MCAAGGQIFDVAGLLDPQNPSSLDGRWDHRHVESGGLHHLHLSSTLLHLASFQMSRRHAFMRTPEYQHDQHPIAGGQQARQGQTIHYPAGPFLR